MKHIAKAFLYITVTAVLLNIGIVIAQPRAVQRMPEVLRRQFGCSFGLNEELKPYGLIGAAWQSVGGQGGPLGCPLTSEMDVPGSPGRIQTFDFGQIAWSPHTGHKSVQLAYQAGNSIELVWVATEPFNYDFWIVRTDANGTNIDQKDVKARRTDGWFVLRNAAPGQTYSFIVEGCDEVGIFGEGAKAGCRQGWTNRVAVTMKPEPIMTAPTLPDPAVRGTSCWIDPDCIVKTVKDAAEVVTKVADAVKAVVGSGKKE